MGYGLSVGIVGLPNSGKSTLFNAFLKRQIAQVAEYPFTTIEPNTGVVEVPDERLDKLIQLVKLERKTQPRVVPAAVKFIDIAGLVKGANEGEGLGNKFLAHIREVDAILHVVRAFENENVSHVHGKIDPAYDVEIVNLELELAGIVKPTLYVLNVGESQLAEYNNSNPRAWSISSPAEEKTVLTICAKLEMELSELTPAEQSQYLKELGVNESGLDKIIKESYNLLNLIAFFTIAKGTQVQAWPLRAGSTALRASYLVHSDFAKGFIKAEVVSWQDLVNGGSWLKAAEAGKIRLEGKDYQVQDGDVIEFKFQV